MKAHDGSVLAFGKQGVHEQKKNAGAHPALLVFDLLAFNGSDLMPLPLRQRRERLVAHLVPSKVVEASASKLMTTAAELREAFADANRQSLEGLMLKGVDSKCTARRGQPSPLCPPLLLPPRLLPLPSRLPLPFPSPLRGPAALSAAASPPPLSPAPSTAECAASCACTQVRAQRSQPLAQAQKGLPEQRRVQVGRPLDGRFRRPCRHWRPVCLHRLPRAPWQRSPLLATARHRSPQLAARSPLAARSQLREWKDMSYLREMSCTSYV